MHPDVCERAMKRYASWPGQAVSYKVSVCGCVPNSQWLDFQVGQLCILELRAYCEQELGSLFDIKWFHTQVVLNALQRL